MAKEPVVVEAALVLFTLALVAYFVLQEFSPGRFVHFVERRT